MKKFTNWLYEEEKDPSDKSEGYRKATLLMNYMDEPDLFSALEGGPSKPIVYRFLAILENLPTKEKIEFQQQIQKLQANWELQQKMNTP